GAPALAGRRRPRRLAEVLVRAGQRRRGGGARSPLYPLTAHFGRDSARRRAPLPPSAGGGGAFHADHGGGGSRPAPPRGGLRAVVPPGGVGARGCMGVWMGIRASPTHPSMHTVRLLRRCHEPAAGAARKAWATAGGPAGGGRVGGGS